LSELQTKKFREKRKRKGVPLSSGGGGLDVGFDVDRGMDGDGG